MIRLREWRLFRLADELRLAAFSPLCAGRVALPLPIRFPRRVGIFLTDRCNFRCPMCAVKDARTATAEMPLAWVDRLLAECGKNGAVVDLIGGEPLLYRQLAEALRAAAEYRAVAAVTTNGLLLAEQAEVLVRNRLPILQVSLDGWDEASQTRRGGAAASFEPILHGLREIERLKAGRPFPIVRVLTAITRHNYHSLDRIQQVVASSGVRYWGVTNYFFVNAKAFQEHQQFAAVHGLDGPVAGHALEADRYLSEKQVAGLKQSLARVRSRNGRLGLRMAYAWGVDVDRYYSPVPPGRNCRCELPYNRLDVHPDGRLTVCVGGKTVGHVADASLAAVWNGEKLAGYRRLYESARPMPMCFRCCGLSHDIRFDPVTIRG